MSNREGAASASGAPDSTVDRAGRAFLANLRHDLRTPINAILGYSEMLLEDATDGGAADLAPDLERVYAAGSELLALVNDILSNDKIEAGQFDVAMETVAANLHHALRTPVSAVVGYSEMLLEDAADLGADEAVPDLQKIHAAAVSFLSKIDDVVNFSRVESGVLEGDAEAPAAAAMIQEVVEAIAPLDEDDEAPVGSGTVLIVDDNEINRDVLSRRLERQGLGTVQAENGRRALALVGARPFDLVLLDIMMPEMNGYQVLQYLKATPALRDIPVIMVSAMDDISSIVRCIKMGAEDYLPKPFDPVLLRARIGAALEKKRLRDQEVEYLRNVELVIDASAALEANEFKAESLTAVAARADKLGQLARTFGRMAQEVQAREQRLRQEVQQLRIEIDESKATRQVEEIAESDFFQDLIGKASRLRFSEAELLEDDER